MTSKTKNNLSRIPSILLSLVITAGAIMKLANAPQLVEIYSRIGLLPYLEILGITELVFLGLFLVPRTMKIGLLLLTGYYGGAMAAEMSHGTVFFMPAIILTIVWIAAYLKDASMFKIVQRQEKRLTSF
jgi:hypothetical protein